MKFLAVFPTLMASYAGFPSLMVPGDNSHYVQGKSRYIWMADGDGDPYLVDLYEKSDEALQILRDGANNKYLLYTRENPTTAQNIIPGDVNSLNVSNYRENRPIKVIVHGWMSNSDSKINPMITKAFLSVMDCNVIVVDWSHLSFRLYWTSVRAVPDVGVELGNFLKWVIDTAGGDWNTVHLVGHSLGAHVVGNAGRTVGGRIARITGLDPAGPLFVGSTNALNARDAQHVETINTDGGILGIFDPLGVANFYPNGGRNYQPGCWFSPCSHIRAYELFAASVENNHFVAHSCDTLNDAKTQNCNGNVWLNMGNGDHSKHGEGIFSLATGRSWPF